jgi:uncharacterized membrane protein
MPVPVERWPGLWIVGTSQAAEVNTSGVRSLIEVASLAIEIVAIAIIVLAIAYATLLYALHFFLPSEHDARVEAYGRYKIRLGRALLLGLEILVAADIVRTVALQPTPQSVAVLGLLVLIRTFLSWSLVVELEHRWPWQPMPTGGEDPLFKDA